MFSILTRTSGRPASFAQCSRSVKSQTIKSKHIVNTDSQTDNPYVILHNPNVITHIEKGEGQYPYNLYFNKMIEDAEGWIIYLDDDDEFTTPHALEIIKKHLTHEDVLILWKVQFGGYSIPRRCFGKLPTKGDISGIGFCHHKKHFIDWPSQHCGDYEVITQLYNKLEPIWINQILTGLQSKSGKAGLGLRLEASRV